MTYEKIKQNFDKGYWSAQMVQKAVIKGIITQEQYEAIISGSEIDPEQDVLNRFTQEVSEIGYDL